MMTRHPDKTTANTELSDEQKTDLLAEFQLINTAKSVLTDEYKKFIYDLILRVKKQDRVDSKIEPAVIDMLAIQLDKIQEVVKEKLGEDIKILEHPMVVEMLTNTLEMAYREYLKANNDSQGSANTHSPSPANSNNDARQREAAERARQQAEMAREEANLRQRQENEKRRVEERQREQQLRDAERVQREREQQRLRDHQREQDRLRRELERSQREEERRREQEQERAQSRRAEEQERQRLQQAAERVARDQERLRNEEEQRRQRAKREADERAAREQAYQEQRKAAERERKELEAKFQREAEERLREQAERRQRFEAERIDRQKNPNRENIAAIKLVNEELQARLNDVGKLNQPEREKALIEIYKSAKLLDKHARASEEATDLPEMMDALMVRMDIITDVLNSLQMYRQITLMGYDYHEAVDENPLKLPDLAAGVFRAIEYVKFPTHLKPTMRDACNRMLASMARNYTNELLTMPDKSTYHVAENRYDKMRDMIKKIGPDKMTDEAKLAVNTYVAIRNMKKVKDVFIVPKPEHGPVDPILKAAYRILVDLHNYNNTVSSHRKPDKQINYSFKFLVRKDTRALSREVNRELALILSREVNDILRNHDPDTANETQRQLAALFEPANIKSLRDQIIGSDPRFTEASKTINSHTLKKALAHAKSDLHKLSHARVQVRRGG